MQRQDYDLSPGMDFKVFFVKDSRRNLCKNYARHCLSKPRMFSFINWSSNEPQIMVQMEMSKPWTHPWWTWNGRISWVFWNRKELPGEYMRISTHCCSLLPSPQLLLLSYRGYDAAGNSVYPCMRWDKDSYRFSRATSLRGTEISWLSSSGPPLSKDVGCKSIFESVNS